jgi:ArsR family transcriptional regulator
MTPSLSRVEPHEVFRALSDPTRLRILLLLRTGELCVCEVVNALQISQPTASKHLAVLRRVGLTVARKEGVWSYHKLTADGDPFLESVLNCVGRCPVVPPPRSTSACPVSDLHVLQD